MLINIPNRSFIVLSGIGAKDFLQSVCTTDIKKLSANNGVWGAILSPQGKFKFEFIAFEYDRNIYIETSNEILMDFGKYLSKYSLNTNTDFSIDNTIKVYVDITKNSNHIKSTETNQNKDIVTINDPRTNDIGDRLYALNSIELASTGYLIDYETLRIKNSVPNLEVDANSDESYPLELNMDKFNGVCFEKGCYIGQEVTARMHYRNSTKRNLVKVKCSNICSSSDTISSDEGNIVGVITSCAGLIAMASIRKEYLITGNKYFTQNGTKITIII